MAGKKHGKKKRFQQVSRPTVQNTQVDLTQPVDSSPTMTAAAPVVKAAPAAKTAPAGKGATATAKVISYEYFTGDLKRIGILMAVIIVVLIILGFVIK